jgi:predicted GNAT family acetyltransferase
VQIGGVWTPPPLRSRGHARAVVGGSLLLARAQGMRRSVLFTGEDNVAALRSYERLGYVRAGRFGLWLPPAG